MVKTWIFDNFVPVHHALTLVFIYYLTGFLLTSNLFVNIDVLEHISGTYNQLYVKCMTIAIYISTCFFVGVANNF